jgi:hypothetical protein
MGGRLLLLLGSCAFALVLAELGARAIGDTRMADDILTYRMRPDGRDIDPRGFRNGPTLIAQAEVVALGDSHTFGFNVEPGEAWPRQLESLLGRRVYNLGVGGYGPLEYEALVEEALRLRPRHLVLALYPTNDLEDVCGTFLRSPYWQRRGRVAGESLAYCHDVDHQSLPSMGGDGRSALHDLMRRAEYWLRRNVRSFINGPVVEVRAGATPIRLTAHAVRGLTRQLDPGREETRRSARVTERILEDMGKALRAGGVRFRVLLLPHRHSVLFPYIEKGPLAREVEVLVGYETALRARFEAFLASRGIDCVDATPYLRNALRGPAPVYGFQLDDGHPLAPGYRAYAEAAFDRWETP